MYSQVPNGPEKPDCDNTHLNVYPHTEFDEDAEVLTLVRIGKGSADEAHIIFGDARKPVVREGDVFKKPKKKKPLLASTYKCVKHFEIADIADVEPAINEALSIFHNSKEPATDCALSFLYGTAPTQPGQFGKRNRAGMIDAPRRLHVIDIDDLVAPDRLRGKSIEAHAAWLCSEVLPEPWCDVSCVIMFTGSHGTEHQKTEKYVPKMRVFLMLDKPMAIERFGDHVEQLNEALCSNSQIRRIGDAVDVSIYDGPERMIFFLPPAVDGDGTPFAGKRVAYIDGDMQELELDDASIPHKPAGRSRSKKSSGGAGARDENCVTSGLDIDQCRQVMRETGHTHRPMRRIRWLIAASALHDGPGARKQYLTELAPRLIEDFRAIDPDPDQVNRRIAEEIGGSLDHLTYDVALHDIESRCVPKLRMQLGTPNMPYPEQPKPTPPNWLAEPSARAETNEISSEHREMPIAEIRERLTDKISRVALAAIDRSWSVYSDDACAGKAAADWIEFRVPPGSGKSRSALEAVAMMKLPGDHMYIWQRHRVLYLCHDKDNAKQRLREFKRILCQVLRRDGLSEGEADELVKLHSRRWQSRPEQCAIERDNKDSPIVKACYSVEKRGQSPLHVCEQRCELFKSKTCEYHIAKNDKSPGVIFATHARIATSLQGWGPDDERGPIITFIDESFLNTITSGHKTQHPITRLGDGLPRMTDWSLKKHGELLTYRYKLKDHLTAIPSDETRLRTHAIGWWNAPLTIERSDKSKFAARRITQAIAIEQKYRDQMMRQIEREHEENGASKQHADLLRHREVSIFVLKIYSALRATLDVTPSADNGHKDRPHVVGITVGLEKDKDAKSDERVPHVFCHTRHDMPYWLRKQPVIFLDATGNQQLIRALVNDVARVTFIEWHAEVDPNTHDTTIFVGKSFGKTGLISKDVAKKPNGIAKLTAMAGERLPRRDGHFMRIRAELHRIAFQHSDQLAISQSAVEERLEQFGLLPNTETAHYPLAGSNEYEMVSSVSLIGRWAANEKDLKRKIEAIWYDDATFAGVSDEDGIRHCEQSIELKDGSTTKTTREFWHEPKSDEPRGELVRQQISDAIKLQAAYRARFFNRTEATKVTVTSFGPTDLGLKPDRVINWQEHPLLSFKDMADANGIYFGSRYSSLLAYGFSLGICNDDNTSLKKEHAAYRKAVFDAWACGEMPGWVKVKFKAQTIDGSKRAYPQEAIVNTDRYERNNLARVLADNLNRWATLDDQQKARHTIFNDAKIVEIEIIDITEPALPDEQNDDDIAETSDGELVVGLAALGCENSSSQINAGATLR
jgi:hypothetical protein